MRHCTCSGSVKMVEHVAPVGDCRWCVRWRTDGEYRRAIGAKVAQPVKPSTFTCVYRDDTGPKIGEATCAEGCGKGVRLPVRACSKFGKCVVAKTTVEGYRCCRDCNERVEPLSAHLHPVGVVIGSYKWPSLVALQIATIRATCGPVPICVSSDHPETASQVDDICSQHPDVFHWPNWTRIGHTGGDISAFFKGIVWGASRGLKVVAKLSQRFIVTWPDWLHDGAKNLLESGLALATQRCRGTQRFDLRSEACLLNVARWNTPDVLARIMPRRYWKDSPKGLTAETVISRLLQDLLGEFFWPWSLFGEDRSVKSPGVVWHLSHNRAEYERLAERYGVKLEADFHVHGWQQDRAAGAYQIG